MKYFLSTMVGFLLAVTFFKELYLLVPLLLVFIIVYLLKNKDFYKRKEFLLGIVAFVVTHNHWYLSLNPWVGINNAILIWLGISLYFCLVWYVFFYLLKYLLRIPKGYFLIPVYWTAFEWLLSQGVFGYPFMSLYLTQAGSPFQWLAYSIIHSYSISLYLLSISTIIALIITKKITSKLNIVLFALLFFIMFVVATDSYLNKTEVYAKSIHVSIIQPNIKQSDKTNEKLFNEHLEKYLGLINLVIEEEPETDIVILPENIIPALWEDTIKDRLCFSTNLENRLCVFGQPVKRENRIYNAMLFYKQGHYVAEYHKRQLVPFGEYWPILSDWISLSEMVYYSPGGEMNSPISIQSLKIAPFVCFESAFPHFSNSLRQFHLGVVITNDAWFNRNFRLLHLRTAQFRATESFSSFAYSANNGISTLINANGKIVSVLPDQKTGYISAKMGLPTSGPKLIQILFFYLPIWFFCLLVILLIKKEDN
ncbi:MAG: apolipoprotein N-acyltransferase [Candidatus Margulisbacteria bacterium]|nr:apolipoprotein N-acyltransferase [Candidatus Margulisiibacteriota bacterium]